MKRIYILEDLDCAHCAAKIEEDISKLNGVEKCSINFLTRKMIIEASEDIKEIEKQAEKIIKKLEPDVEMVIK